MPVMERVRAIAEELRNEALAGLPPAERDRLIETLMAVRANLSERGAPRNTAAEAAADYA